MEGKGQRCVQGIRATIYDNKIWMFDRWINALFSMDIETGKTEYVLSIENEPKYQEALVSHIVGYKNKLFLNPLSAQSAVLIDLETMKQTKIYLERKENIWGVKNSNVIQKDSLIYMFPITWGDALLIYDFDKCVVHKVPIDYSFIVENNISMEGFRWGSGCKVKDGYCLSILNTPGIFYLRHSGEWKFYRADTKNAGFLSCVLCDDDLYLLPYQGTDIMIFHLNSRKYDKLALEKELIHKYDIPYSTIEKRGNKIYLFPTEEKNIIIFDLDTKNCILYDIGKNQYPDCRIYGNEIYAFPDTGNDIVIIDTQRNKMRSVKMLFPDKYGTTAFVDYWIYQIPCFPKEKKIHSERVICLRDFVKLCLNQKTNNIITNNNHGLNIYEKCINELEKENL